MKYLAHPGRTQFLSEFAQIEAVLRKHCTEQWLEGRPLYHHQGAGIFFLDIPNWDAFMAAIHDAGGQVYGAPCAVRRGWCVQLFFDDLLNMGPGVLSVLDEALAAQVG